jgi:hypothetical protein
VHLLVDLLRRPWTGPALAAAGLLAAISLDPGGA